MNNLVLETTGEQIYNGWIKFWTDFGNFFMVTDASGLNYLARISISVAIVFVAFFLIKFVGWILRKAFRIKKKGPQLDVSAKSFLVTIIKSLLWITVSFGVCSILKIDLSGAVGITSAVTVAVGLALQDLLGSMFSGILLLQQKIVKTDEFIAVTNSSGTAEGFVKSVHLFFTNLRTFEGQIITIPNKNMTIATITNYSRMGKRRIDFDVGVSYKTDVSKAKVVFMELLDKDDRVLKEDGTTVFVNKLDSYSIQIRLRCWTKYENYWPVYNELSEKIYEACLKNDINIPSSTELHINNQK